MREGMKRIVARVVLVAFLSLSLSTCGGGGGGGGAPGGSTSGTDTTAPTVSSTSAANGATGAAVNASISVIFSEPMDASTINASTFTVKAGATAVPGTVSYSGTTATFTPTDNLAYSTSYTATVTTGAKDLAGNALASNYVWSFTRRQHQHPRHAHRTSSPPTSGNSRRTGRLLHCSGCVTRDATFRVAGVV